MEKPSPKLRASPRPKRVKHLRVPVFPDEEIRIVELAESTGLSVAAYLRNLGMGFTPSSTLDAQLIQELSKINAAQSSLGNLMKLALSNPEKAQLYGDMGVAKEMQKLIPAIRKLQDEMLAVVESIKI